jgi:pimeloyl-ACP methyl ester carboxylesterase
MGLLRRRARLALAAGLGLATGGSLLVWLRPAVEPADWGAAAIVHPWRRPLSRPPDLPFEPVAFESQGERLEGWLFRPAPDARRPGRELVVYLHGIADNRESGVAVARRLLPRGYPVFVFDARAHGRSTGDACTYGYYERHDVARALDALRAPRAILLGHSLGAAVALQAAAIDARIDGVVAASSFSDLETIVRERARWLHVPQRYVEPALVRAGVLGRFPPAQASPLALAPRVTVPVLLLHGAVDAKTGPDHSRRIARALGGPCRLVVLPGVGHDEILGREEAWREIVAFLESMPAPAP